MGLLTLFESPDRMAPSALLLGCSMSDLSWCARSVVRASAVLVDKQWHTDGEFKPRESTNKAPMKIVLQAHEDFVAAIYLCSSSHPIVLLSMESFQTRFGFWMGAKGRCKFAINSRCRVGYYYCIAQVSCSNLSSYCSSVLGERKLITH